MALQARYVFPYVLAEAKELEREEEAFSARLAGNQLRFPAVLFHEVPPHTRLSHVSP